LNKVKKGKLVLIVGPSGSGKGTIIKNLRDRHPDWVYPISCTTREIREGEVKDQVYHFISEEEFKKGISDGRFLEYAIVHGTQYYGTDKKEIIDAVLDGKVVVREVDIQGFHSIKKVFEEGFGVGFDGLGLGQLLSIFIEAKDLDELRRRIATRGKLPEDEVERRMESARKEIALASDCDYRVVNEYGKVEEAVNQVENFICGDLNGRCGCDECG